MKALEKRVIQTMDKPVTFIGFGSLSIGRDWGMGDNNSRPSEEEAGRVLNAVLDKGITLVDTASAYHRSEERIGKYIANRRSDYMLASKCGEHNSEPSTYYDFSYDAVKGSIDRSLALLKTDVIDIMQIHFGPNPEEVLEKGETLRAMKDARDEGKIRYLGASIDGELARRCIESGDFDVMQMEYHLLNQTNDENIKRCKDKGMGVFIRTGLGRGLLTPKVTEILNNDFPEKERVKALLDLVEGNSQALTQMALQFLYQNEGISSVLIGTKSIERLEQNMRLLDMHIDQNILKKAIEIGA